MFMYGPHQIQMQHLYAKMHNVPQKAFDGIPASSPLFPTPYSYVITVPSTATMSQALQKLIKNKVMSVPVVDKDNKPIGLLTIMGIISRILDIFKRDELRTKDLLVLMRKKEDLNKEMILNHKDMLEEAVTVSDNVNVTKVIYIMLSQNIHRVIVKDEKEKLVNIISETRIVQLLSMLVDGFRDLTSKSMRDIGIYHKEVITVQETSMVWDAFQTMKEKRINSVAVINKDGHMVGNLSVSDIKILGYDVRYFWLLSQSTSEYLRIVKAEGEKGEVPSCIKCYEFSSLGHIVRSMNYFKIHQIYMVDEQDKPIGYITAQDLMKAMLTYEESQ